MLAGSVRGNNPPDALTLQHKEREKEGERKREREKERERGREREREREGERPTLASSQTDTNRQLQSEDCCLFGEGKEGGREGGKRRENLSDMQLSGEHFHMQNSE